MKTKIFVIGAKGLLGSNIVKANDKKYSFFEGYNQALGNSKKSDSIKVAFAIAIAKIIRMATVSFIEVNAFKTGFLKTFFT